VGRVRADQNQIAWRKILNRIPNVPLPSTLNNEGEFEFRMKVHRVGEAFSADVEQIQRANRIRANDFQVRTVFTRVNATKKGLIGTRSGK
jgi:hypothetical protein